MGWSPPPGARELRRDDEGVVDTLKGSFALLKEYLEAGLGPLSSSRDDLSLSDALRRKNRHI